QSWFAVCHVEPLRGVLLAVAETASLSRTQILQQAGTAMVAQASQLPQGVLSLLR
ncbi:flagellin, partial [Comamonas kerstersii]|uniref:flagellin n=1 Tax=Comamonas kerstersii TaxID=225992 RepID=UPI003EE1D4C7